jgi:hypothetical protein
MVEYALEPVRPSPGPDAARDDRIAGALRGMHAALDRHPGAVELIMAESETAPLEEFRNDLLDVLGHAGLSPTESADALRSLTSYVLGYTVLTRMRPRDARRHPPAGWMICGTRSSLPGTRESPS